MNETCCGNESQFHSLRLGKFGDTHDDRANQVLLRQVTSGTPARGWHVGLNPRSTPGINYESKNPEFLRVQKNLKGHPSQVPL